MVEMTLPFWLDSTVLSATETVNAWLKTRHFQPRWIDEVIYIEETGSELEVDLTGIEPNVPEFHWTWSQTNEQLIFQAACREIAVDDRNLILLLSSQAQQTTVVLLASPAAVGMYNLMPMAYVEDLIGLRISSGQAEVFKALEAALLKRQRKPVQLKQLLLVSENGKRPVKAETPFASAGWVKSQNPAAGALTACHELIGTLVQKLQTNGLAVELTTAGQLFATWIERV